jgi:hypothetical protein
MAKNNPYAEYGFVPIDENNPYAEYGFVPIKEQDRMQQEQHPQEQQRQPYQMHMNQERQNTIPGGFVTNLGNSGISTINQLLNGIPQIGAIPSMPNTPFINKNHPGLRIPEFSEPENPSTAYNIGHALGYVPEVSGGIQLLKHGIPAALRGAKNIIGKGINSISPGKTAQTLEEVASEASNKLVRKPSEEMFNEAFGKSNNSHIYEDISAKGNKSFENLIESVERKDLPGTDHRYLDLNPEEVSTAYADAGLKRLHKTFIKNPNLENAHTLQSQLGNQIRDINSKGKLATPAEKYHRASYEYAKDILNNDIGKFLETTTGKGAEQLYKNAKKLYRETVVPHENAERIIRESFNHYTKKTNPETLAKSLENAYTGENFVNNPLPQDIMRLNELMKSQLRNKKYLIRSAIGIGGLTGANKLRHFAGY